MGIKIKRIFLGIIVVVGGWFLLFPVHAYAFYPDDEEMMQQIREALREQEEIRAKWGESGENCKYDKGKTIVKVDSKDALFQDIGYRIKNHENDIYYDT